MLLSPARSAALSRPLYTLVSGAEMRGPEPGRAGVEDNDRDACEGTRAWRTCEEDATALGWCSVVVGMAGLAREAAMMAARISLWRSTGEPMVHAAETGAPPLRRYG